MHKRITFRAMDHSNHIENHANEQLEKIMHFLSNEPTPVHVDLVLEAGRPHAHNKVELRIKTPHYEECVTDEGPHMLQVIDAVIDTMYRLLHEAKRKRVDDRKRNKAV